MIRIWHQGWHETHAHLVPSPILAYRTPPHFWLWLKSSSDTYWVAEEKGLLGFVSIEGSELAKLYVSSQARGKGVAAALLSHAEGQLYERGVVEAEIHCTQGNKRAQRFYEREGWVLMTSPVLSNHD